LWFRGGRHRDYAILHKAGSRYTSEQWWARTFADVGLPAALDLRDRDHVEELEAALQAVNLDGAIVDRPCPQRRRKGK
jgi:hypothetical protein